MAAELNSVIIETLRLKFDELIESNDTDKINSVLKLLDSTPNKEEDEEKKEILLSRICESSILNESSNDLNDELNKRQIKIDWTGYALSHLRYKEEEKLQYYSNKDLFVILSKYLFIYSLPGNEKGEPRTIINEHGDDDENRNKLSIIRILNKYDLVLIAAQQRDYTTKKYVKCLLPVPGWIYLPQITIKKWINSDKLNNDTTNSESMSMTEFDINSSPKNGRNYKIINMNQLFPQQNEINELHESLGKDLQNENYQNIDFLKQEIVPITHPLPQMIFCEDFDTNNIDKNDDNDNIKHEKKGKCISALISLINWIIRWMRVHPWCPMLLLVLIQAVIEAVIFTDIITDCIVIIQLYKVSTSIGNAATFFFMVSAIFLMSPYLVAWVATTQWVVRKSHTMQIQVSAQKIDKIALSWKVGVILFSIAPIGMFVLLIGDIVHVIEYTIIRPVLYLLSLCIDKDWKILKLRVISFEELGYWKLRRVSEIFSESIPQSILQLLLLILLSQSKEALDLNVWSVALALISSAIVTVFWCIVLLIESRMNGMNFVEYVTVVFQGSFKFVPYLPAIERGGKTGINVNWTQYRLDNDGLGLIAKAFITPSCKISKLKISMYTIQNLNRSSCKYFGKTISQYNDENNVDKRLELILSRQEQDINDLFEIYDIDDDQNFNFMEFARCCIVMRKDVAGSVSLYNVSELFWDLVGNNNNNNKNQIWLLDLLLKIRSSKQRISLLDYDHSLNFALKNNYINLITLLIAANYHKSHESEYKQCIIESMVGDHDKKKEKCTLALCEEEGVPIIVEVLSATLNNNNDGKYNPFVVISIPRINTEIKSTILYNTNTPFWQNQYLLFIIPFNKIDKSMNHGGTSMFDTFHIGGTGESNMVYIDYDDEKQSVFKNIDEEKQEKHEKYEEQHIVEPVKHLLNTQLNAIGDIDTDNDIDNDNDSNNDKNENDENKYKEKKSIEKKVRLQIYLSEPNEVKRRKRTESVSGDHEYNTSVLVAINSVHTPSTELPNNITPHSKPSTFRTPSINFDNYESSKIADVWDTHCHLTSHGVIRKEPHGRLHINVKVQTAKNDTVDNDEIIGGCKLKIDITKDIGKIHEKIIERDLHIRNKNKSIKNKEKYIVSGNVRIRIYLNALYKYRKHGLQY